MINIRLVVDIIAWCLCLHVQCLRRLPAWLQLYEQYGQVCVFRISCTSDMWACKICFSEKRLRHWSHLKGRCLLCTHLTCLRKLEGSLNVFWHWSHLNDRCLSCIADTWTCKLRFWEKRATHWSHLNGRCLSCTTDMWTCKLPFLWEPFITLIAFKRLSLFMYTKYVYLQLTMGTKCFVASASFTAERSHLGVSTLMLCEMISKHRTIAFHTMHTVTGRNWKIVD